MIRKSKWNVQEPKEFGSAIFRGRRDNGGTDDADNAGNDDVENDDCEGLNNSERRGLLLVMRSPWKAGLARAVSTVVQAMRRIVASRGMWIIAASFGCGMLLEKWRAIPAIRPACESRVNEYPYWLVDRLSKVEEQGGPTKVSAEEAAAMVASSPNSLDGTFAAWCRSYGEPNLLLAPFADKRHVKRWVSSRFHARTADLFGAVSAPEDITPDFLAAFPSRTFVMKAAHLSGGIVLVDLASRRCECLKPPCAPPTETPPHSYLQASCRLFLSTNYAHLFGERFYEWIRPSCLFERRYLMGHDAPQHPGRIPLADIKFHYFHTRPMFFRVYGTDGERNSFLHIPSTATNNAIHPHNHTAPNNHQQTILQLPACLASNTTHCHFPTFTNTSQLLPMLHKHVPVLEQTATEMVTQINRIVPVPFVRVDFFFALPHNDDNNDKNNNNNNSNHQSHHDINSYVPFWGEFTFMPDACHRYFHKFPKLAKFYRFVIDHPQYDIPPETALYFTSNQEMD